MSVKGWGALVRKVTRIRDGIEQAPQKAAQAWVDADFKPYAQQIAPVRSGQFRDSIDGRVSKTRVTVFADAPHARYVEEGTSKMEAQPTIKPAFEHTKDKLRQRVRDEVKKVTR
ncbi:HK97-gp10 family putative phage morphogenesis protein [Sphingobium lactosutens]|uniref:HK97-gp10 family putative phage morphogenesis protein n=1 Tax=Sphingobium lactosutens TaxID=522773 RepID=UPI001D1933DA|nr:HK97-gp10 family putative phage morphogenesis protein [Sphingobium lactosutens]MCC4257002.1 HK97 gp10 family phage protein [Sphingobium lactosutens]